MVPVKEPLLVIDIIVDNEWNRVFVKIAGSIFFTLPILLGTIILIWSPKNTVYSFFVFLSEMSLVSGIITKIEDVQRHSIMVISGLLIAAIISSIFSWQYGIQNGFVSFLIYNWVWLSLYEAGLEIHLEFIEHDKLLSSLIVVVGSIATLSWYWFGFFF